MNPVLDAVLRSAAEATGATAGWLVGVDGRELVVMSATGSVGVQLVGRRIPSGMGAVGYAVASGQPLALTPNADDPRLDDDLLREVPGPTTAVLCVPCGGEDAVHGALQLVNKAGGGSFDFDDVELATLLAGIAGTAIESADAGPAAPTPQQLFGELARFADSDPAGYAAVARLVGALLDRA